MRYFILLLVSAAVLFSCKTDKVNRSLPEAFIASLQQNDFEELDDFFPDAAFYKALGSEMPQRTDEEINKFLHEAKQRLREGWEKMRQNAADKQIAWDKLAIKETLVYDPFSSPTMEATLVIYTYDGRDWDDLSFISKELNGKTWLLEFPNPARAFSMADTTLREWQRARAVLLQKDPGFEQKVKDQVNLLSRLAKENDVEKLAGLLVYRGEDENRKWKSPLDAASSDERMMAESEMKRIAIAAAGCSEFQYEKIISERESEGLWIVLPVICAGKKIHFAFLLVNEQLLLGEVEAGPVEER